MKDNLKIAFLFVLIVGCIILIIRNITYKNILLLVLPFLSFYLGKIHEHRKRNKEEKTQVHTPLSNVPQEFKDEQKRFEELTK